MDGDVAQGGAGMAPGSEALSLGQNDGPSPCSPPGGATRLHILARLMALCFTSIAMVVFGNALLALPQIREGLWAFDDGEGDALLRQSIFVLAFLYWAATTWYVARLTLGRRFPYDSVGSSSSFVQGVAQWLPRLLSLAACLPLALFLLGTGKHVALACVLIVVSVLFILFTWGRRRLIASSEDNPDNCYYRYYERLTPGSFQTLLVGFAVPHLVLIAILVNPIGTSRAIGAPALMLLAIGAWALVGGMVLSYWPRSKGCITFGWAPVLLLVAFSSYNDNHAVDWQAGPWHSASTSAPVDGNRPSLKTHYERWINARPFPGEPVYLIASAGGASRASYWAGTVLGRLEDEARSERRHFGSNIFMMSGVSGGSVGIAAYAAALRTWPFPESDKPLAPGDHPASGCFRLAMDRFLGEDVLSPVGALMLYPDMIQRFMPAVAWSHRIDRSRGLEEAWDRDWQALMKQPPMGCAPSAVMGDLWSQSIIKAFEAKIRTPALVLNTARLEDGRRVLQSNLQFDLRDADDLLGAGFEARARAMSLAGAAHNSARFPLVSPPGSVHTAAGKIWGHLGDGGYHEVTGAATLADVVEALIELGCLRQEPPVGDKPPARLFARSMCQADASKASSPGPGRTAPEPPPTTEARVVVVLLDNTPTDYSAEWQRDLEGVPRRWPRSDRAEILRRPPMGEPVEILGPVRGLLSHSSQEARSAEQRLAALAGTDPLSLIELRLPRYRGLREPSMNWQLDHDSRREMMCASDAHDRPARPLLSVGKDEARCSGEESGFLPRRGGLPANLADKALLRNLDRLRGWIRQRGGQPVLTGPHVAQVPKKAGT